MEGRFPAEVLDSREGFVFKRFVKAGGAGENSKFEIRNPKG